MSISRVEAYLRSAEFVQRPSGVKRLIYMRLPHPAVHEKHGQYQVRKIKITATRICKIIRITRKQKVNTGRGSLWYVFCFQFASLYNPVDKRVKERVKKMLLLGVTQRSEMRRHLNVFVAENFPDVSELDSSFYPSDRRIEFFNVPIDDSTQADAYRPGACLEACKVQVGIDAK